MSRQPPSRSAEILRAVHREPGLPRVAATRDLGISSGLATDAVARLIDARLLAEAPSPPSGARGRPSRQLVPHPDGPLVATLVIAHSGWELELVELGGAVVLRRDGRHDRRWPPLRRKLQAQLDRAYAAYPGRVVTLCVSVPGTVSGGRLIQAPNLGWSDIDIAAAFTAPLVLVDNDATFSAIGEARRGASRDEPSIVHVYMDHGIGGALLEDGRVIGGAQGIAGEFGHMPFGAPDTPCSCGAYGCWNTAVDGSALAAAVGAPEPEDAVTFATEVLREARERPGRHRQAAAAAATVLGRGAAALVNGFDPSIVCLGGLAAELRAVAPGHVDAAYTRGLMSGRRAAPPPIVDGALGARGTLVGAAEHGFDALLTERGLAAWNTR